MTTSEGGGGRRDHALPIEHNEEGGGGLFGIGAGHSLHKGRDKEEEWRGVRSIPMLGGGRSPVRPRAPVSRTVAEGPFPPPPESRTEFFGFVNTHNRRPSRCPPPVGLFPEPRTSPKHPLSRTPDDNG